MKSFFRYIVVSFIAIMNSCSDEIALDTELDTQLLIFGTLTNIPDIVTIEIHKTVALEKKGINPVTNAAISLYSKEPNGTKTLVTNNFEVLNNKYQSAEIITAEVGVSYWIEIT